MPFGNRLRQLLSISLTISLLSLSSMIALAAPGNAKPLGSLSATGEVYLNDSKAISGMTVFTDSRIMTTAESNAMVSLGQLGGLSILPQSSVSLSFSDSSVSTQLDSGRVSLYAPKGISYSVATVDGLVVADGSQETKFSVSIEDGKTYVTTEAGQVELRSSRAAAQTVGPGQNAMLGATPGQITSSSGNSLSNEKKVAIGVGVGAGAAFLIWLALRDDDEVISPIT